MSKRGAPSHSKAYRKKYNAQYFHDVKGRSLRISQWAKDMLALFKLELSRKKL